MTRKRKSDTTPLDEADRTLYSTFCSAANSLSQLYTHAMNHQKVAFQAGERQALMDLQNTAVTVQLGRGASIQLANAIINTGNAGATIQFGSVDFPAIAARNAVAPVRGIESEGSARRPHRPETTIRRAHPPAPRATITAENPRRRISVFERLSQSETPVTKREKLYQWIIKQHEEGSRVTAADIVAHIENEIDYGGDDAAISPRLHFQHQFPQSTPHLPNSSIQTSPGFVGQHSYVVPRTSHSEQVKNSVFLNALSSPVDRCIQPYQLAQVEGPCGQGGTRSNYLNSSTDVQESNSPNPNDASMEIH